MSSFSEWDERRGKIKSKKGGWRIGTKVESHGYDLVNDFVGKCSYMQIVILNATGKMPTREFSAWIEAAFICLSWPDSRVWCNRVGALGGTVHATPMASVSAGNMAAESLAYGPRTFIKGMNFIKSAYKTIREDGVAVADFIQNEVDAHGGKPHLMGYARPLVRGDERVSALERVARDNGFEVGPYVSLAFEIEEELAKKFDEVMNLNSYMSAFMIDQGVTSTDACRIYSAMVVSGVAASYVDNVDDKPGLFSPLQVDDIEYRGESERKVIGL